MENRPRPDSQFHELIRIWLRYIKKYIHGFSSFYACGVYSFFPSGGRCRRRTGRRSPAPGPVPGVGHVECTGDGLPALHVLCCSARPCRRAAFDGPSSPRRDTGGAKAVSTWRGAFEGMGVPASERRGCISPVIDRRDFQWPWLCGLRVLAVLGSPHLPANRRLGSFTPGRRVEATSESSGGSSVFAAGLAAFFVGCLEAFAFPHVGAQTQQNPDSPGWDRSLDSAQAVRGGQPARHESSVPGGQHDGDESGSAHLSLRNPLHRPGAKRDPSTHRRLTTSSGPLLCPSKAATSLGRMPPGRGCCRPGGPRWDAESGKPGEALPQPERHIERRRGGS